jgi:hypothetical protein
MCGLGVKANPLDTLLAGRWMAVGRNKIRDVVPVPKPPGSYDAIVTTWGGGFSIPNPPVTS